MDILITEDQLKRIIKEQQFKYTPPVDNVPKSDYLGKGGEFERTQRARQGLKLDKNPIKNVKTFSQRALDIIMKHENFSPTTYFDTSNKKTIGYGTRIDYHPELEKKRLTKSQALEIMKSDINKIAVSAINEYVKVPLSQNEFDALVSLVYNIGRKRFINSKLLNDINSGNLKSLRKNWSEFRRDGGGVSQGLVNRRSMELNLFNS